MEAKARILLAEDDPAQREVLQELLELEGYQVNVSSNASELIEALGNPPDAVLLDVVGVTSGEVRSALARTLPRPAVLVVSGQPKLGEVARWLGADAFVPKPFDLEELLGALDGALRNRAIGHHGTEDAAPLF